MFKVLPWLSLIMVSVEHLRSLRQLGTIVHVDECIRVFGIV